MTTLAGVRAELHWLAERQATLRLRVRRGELVERHRLTHAAMMLGHRHRDLILNAPVRYGVLLAAEHELDARLLLRALDRIMHEELAAHAAAARAGTGMDGGTA
jgi:hypothetical protein